MAGVASDTQTVTVEINGVEIEVPKGELIVEAVKRLGLEIPIFCYHPRMKPVGMCRMCLVEVGFKQPDGSARMMPKPQAGCTLPASEGMVVITDSEAVHKDRKGVLEFLLVNHPLDCPICDRGGECPLQNNTLFYGPSTSRYVEVKRHLPKAYPLSDRVTLDLERCIQCGRCVRFTEEISGDSELAFRFRGANMTPATFELREFASRFSGNTIEICPVGALTSSQYRFRARPWDVQTSPGICSMCSNGCSVWLDHRVGKLVRVNGRVCEPVNEEWTCDRGKFGHDWLNGGDRLAQVFVRSGNTLAQSSWAEAYEAIAKAFLGAKGQVAALAGGMASNEALYMLQRVFRRHFKSNNLDHRFHAHLQTREQRIEGALGFKPARAEIARLEDAPTILIFGTCLEDELPIVYLRVRKAWFKKAARVIVAGSRATEVDSFAHSILRCRAGSEAVLAKSLLAAVADSGSATLPEAARKLPAGADLERVEELTGVPERAVREAAALLAPGSAVLASHSLFDVDDAQGALEALGALALSADGAFGCFALHANTQGAEELGVLPDQLPGGAPVPARERGMNTHQILQACIEGKVRALWLMGVDPLSCHPDKELARRALEAVPFLVCQSETMSAACEYANALLPTCAPAEQEGTYVSCERRVQRMGAVLRPVGAAKPAWRALMELSLRLEPSTPFFHAEEVMRAIAAEAPTFAAATYDRLGEEGVLLR
jgi:NADH-quinone oxidoreductase subunit G